MGIFPQCFVLDGDTSMSLRPCSAERFLGQPEEIDAQHEDNQTITQLKSSPRAQRALSDSYAESLGHCLGTQNLCLETTAVSGCDFVPSSASISDLHYHQLSQSARLNSLNDSLSIEEKVSQTMSLCNDYRPEGGRIIHYEEPGYFLDKRNSYSNSNTVIVPSTEHPTSCRDEREVQYRMSPKTTLNPMEPSSNYILTASDVANASKASFLPYSSKISNGISCAPFWTHYQGLPYNESVLNAVCQSNGVESVRTGDVGYGERPQSYVSAMNFMSRYDESRPLCMPNNLSASSDHQIEALKLSISSMNESHNSTGERAGGVGVEKEDQQLSTSPLQNELSGPMEDVTNKTSDGIGPLMQATDSSPSYDNLQLTLAETPTAQKKSEKHITLESTARKAVENFGQRTSIYRGVTKHRWTGRFEAHLWDNTCRREGQARKGRQVYLGGYDSEEKAARAYDLAAIKYWGPTTTINFPLEDYEKELEEMKKMSKQEFVASLRRKSSGFSRGASIYRGVTRHHQHGRWQARIGRVAGNKDLYLGTFSTQEEAAEAYDIAAIKFRGLNAVTNFDMSRYDVEKICSNNNIPGPAMRRTKEDSGGPQLMNGGINSLRGSSLLRLQRNDPFSTPLGSYNLTTIVSTEGLQDRTATPDDQLMKHRFSEALSLQLYKNSPWLIWSRMDQNGENLPFHTGFWHQHSNNAGPMDHSAISGPMEADCFHDADNVPLSSLQAQASMGVPAFSSRLLLSGHPVISHKVRNPPDFCSQLQS
ncbi:hypothetical protein KP509_15G054600 [Ceratopteris richardii]|uniref:AP2/ERF domain-containing protein n=1 Tax=Ceratopteris richardii TaxID=49495 RepID=A0A8T2T3G3_CERRI|nr:hypothetical protein KP509_15G054600 [Ceratopteris richardii]KAH7405044.1 hypothetical protein KP509_15G054600 [Ceratopteris richardii]KAH7405045.1 hypothetical protein KP509_15G054600 [Ceratopteris richardii]